MRRRQREARAVRGARYEARGQTGPSRLAGHFDREQIEAENLKLEGPLSQASHNPVRSKISQSEEKG